MGLAMGQISDVVVLRRHFAWFLLSLGRVICKLGYVLESAVKSTDPRSFFKPIKSESPGEGCRIFI